MKCPHCDSHMDNYQYEIEQNSLVRFYRCTICDSEIVSSSMVSEAVYNQRASTAFFSRNLSQNFAELSR